MHLMLFDAFLAACIATITAETLSDDSLLLNNPSLFYEELPEDLSRNDPETFVFSDQYDASGGDLFPPQDISSLTTDLASLTPDAPLCLPNEGDQPPMRKRRGRRDEGSSGSSCDAISNKPRNPPGRPLKKFDEKIWREFMGSPGDVEPEDLSTVFPILKVPKDDNQNCVPEFPKHLCCAQLGLLESNMDSLRMVFDRMYRCDIGNCFFSPYSFVTLRRSSLSHLPSFSVLLISNSALLFFFQKKKGKKEKRKKSKQSQKP